MKASILAFLLTFSMAAYAAHDLSEMRVTVIDDVPTANHYNWYVSGTGVTNCYGYSCYSSYDAPAGGTAEASGAVLKLLLPDGRIVIAECAMKPDRLRNWTTPGVSVVGAMTGGPFYRDCRTPASGVSIRAKFKGNDVKLFMREPSIDGKGKRYSETYSILRTLQPVAAPTTGN